MKRSVPVLTFVCILTILCAISCKKSDTTAAEASTFKVDGGAAITADSANAVLYDYNGTRLMDVFVYKAGNEILEFHFAPTTGAKTAGTIFGTGSFLSYFESPIVSYDSQSGSINVTTCDTIGNRIVGDFNFVAKQYPYTGSITRTITEGHIVVTKLTR